MMGERVDQQCVFHMRVADLAIKRDGIAHGPSEAFEARHEGDPSTHLLVYWLARPKIVAIEGM